MSRGRGTLVSVVLDTLADPQWASRLVRGRGAKPSHVARHLGARLIRANWGQGPGVAPRERDLLDGDREAHARTVWAGVAAQASRGLDDHLAMVDNAAGLLAAQGHLRQRSQFSEPGLVLVGAHLVAHPGRPIDRTSLAQQLAGKVKARPTAAATGAPYAADEFYEAFSDHFLSSWERDGERSLRDYAPSEILLGSDERPPLVIGRTARSWFDGTDRSVYHRYRLSFRASAAGPGGTHRLDRDEAALAEIKRACQGYGLSRPEHRTALVSLAVAQLDPDQPRVAAARIEQAWRSAPAPLATLPPGTSDRELTLAASAKLRLWHDSPSAWAVRQAHADVAVILDELHWALVRGMWMGLLRREQRNDATTDRPTLNRLMKTVMDRKLPEAVRAWPTIAAHQPWSVRRHEATVELVTGLGAQARDLVGVDPVARAAARTAYELHARTVHGAGWPEVVLTAAEIGCLRGQAPSRRPADGPPAGPRRCPVARPPRRGCSRGRSRYTWATAPPDLPARQLPLAA